MERPVNQLWLRPREYLANFTRYLLVKAKSSYRDQHYCINIERLNGFDVIGRCVIMTHILTNPGYPNGLRFRSKSAEVFRGHERRKQGISQSDFDKIRSLSRQSWKHTWENPGEPLPSVKCNHFVTTYSTTHNYRALQEPTPCRPTSPTRRNNPHPTRFVFLLFVEVVVVSYPSGLAFKFDEVGTYGVHK